MNKVLIFSVILTIVGCQVKTESTNSNDSEIDSSETYEVVDTIPRVTGIGGVFFVSENPDSLNNWYGENLGLAIDAYGSPFEFRNANNPDQVNYLRWSTHGSDAYMKPSSKQFMINYRVNNIEGLIRKLEASGTVMLDSLQTYDYGTPFRPTITANSFTSWIPMAIK